MFPLYSTACRILSGTLDCRRPAPGRPPIPPRPKHGRCWRTSMFRLLCLPMLFMALLLVAAPALAQEPAGGGSASPLTAEAPGARSLPLQAGSRRQALVDTVKALAHAEDQKDGGGGKSVE